MIRMMFVFFSILWATYGCAAHYYKTEGNYLYLYLKKPEANSVYFLCSLDGFKFHKANKVGDNMWEVKVPHQIEFRYFYIIDGEPFVPDCKYKEADDFGSSNCIFVSLL